MTSSTSPQKPLKKRLSALARKTPNRVCCDCPEKAPTWAVILPPPIHAPTGSRDLVALVCFNCAAAHRQLGISHVKSIVLDECKWTLGNGRKEKEDEIWKKEGKCSQLSINDSLRLTISSFCSY